MAPPKMKRRDYLAVCARRRTRVRKLRESGMKLSEIAAKLGITYQAVQSLLRHK